MSEDVNKQPEPANGEIIADRTAERLRPGDVLHYQGERYVIGEWLTRAAYAQKYNLSIQTVISRMNRGSLPGDDVLEVEAWGLRLIRDQAHDSPARGPRRNERPL